MTQTIKELRSSIDAIDRQLVRLLHERSQFVKEVGAIKQQVQTPGACFIRSGREAEMVRNMHAVFKDNLFPAPAAAHMWRIIISASLSLESPLLVSAYGPETQQEIYWYAREYFGNFTPISKEPTTRRVLSEVIDGRAQVGVLPLPDDSAEGKWWLKLPANVKIFACVPFVLPKGGQVKALAVAKLEPENTGDDVSLFSIEIESDVSQSRIKGVLDNHSLEQRWLTVDIFASGHRMHLIEIKGFVTESHDFVREMKSALGTSLLAIAWLGAYALPIQLP